MKKPLGLIVGASMIVMAGVVVHQTTDIGGKLRGQAGGGWSSYGASSQSTSGVSSSQTSGSCTPSGAGCTTDSQCCTQDCAFSTRTCAAPPPGPGDPCLPSGGHCTTDSVCCSDNCNMATETCTAPAPSSAPSTCSAENPQGTCPQGQICGPSGTIVGRGNAGSSGGASRQNYACLFLCDPLTQFWCEEGSECCGNGDSCSASGCGSSESDEEQSCAQIGGEWCESSPGSGECCIVGEACNASTGMCEDEESTSSEDDCSASGFFCGSDSDCCDGLVCNLQSVCSAPETSSPSSS